MRASTDFTGSPDVLLSALRCGRLLVVMLVLAGIDTLVGLYLVVYALRRERRDKDAVLVVGIVLMIWAGVLMAGGRAAGDSAPMGPSATGVASA